MSMVILYIIYSIMSYLAMSYIEGVSGLIPPPKHFVKYRFHFISRIIEFFFSE